MIRRLVFADRDVIWNDTTGRHLVLPVGGTLPDDVIAARLGGAPADLVVARNRRVLLLPERPALWRPLPGGLGPGGFSYAALPLDSDGLRLWRAADGHRTLRAVAEHARVPLPRALAFFAGLTTAEVQAVQLRPGPVRARDVGLKRIVCGPRPPNTRTPDQHTAGATSLFAWHQRIDDAATHFDHGETTVAHAFAVPHPGLRGLRYGEALADAFRRRGFALDAVVEVGPGTGELAAAFLARTGLDPATYTRFDASPALLEAQRRLVPGTREICGDATLLGLPDASVGLLFANEVIADLPADRDGDVLRNVGAWAMVRRIAAVLRPGGVAWLSEFGGPDEAPTETTQLDHPEVSIDFGALTRVATEAGLRAELVPLPEFLGMDLGAPWLARHSFAALRQLDPTLPARAWTVADVPKGETVEGLEDVPLTDEGPGPLPTRFWCVVLRRPPS